MSARRGRRSSRRGEVHVQIGLARLGQQPRNGAFQPVAIDQLPAGDYAVGVEGAHCKRAAAQLLRHRVDGVERFVAVAHIDGKAHPVGRRDGVVLVIDQDQLVAGF